MRVLLDTCVLSELRLPKGDPRVRHAVDVLGSDDLFISVLTVGEIAKGIALLKEGKNKRNLQAWLQTLERDYADRILSVDLEISHIWGELTAAARHDSECRGLPANWCIALESLGGPRLIASRMMP
ncbi:MAG: PIN domain-containing protein [Candidatus Acidiferrales bacterium]